jgi:ferric-dicitrate binding protein FerR (iron transport regulator)
MPDGVDDEILYRYLAGECSAEEEAFVEQWIAESEAHRDRFERIRRLWTLTDRSVEVRDVDQMWASLADRIEREEGSSAATKSRHARDPKQRRRRQSWKRTVRTAASLAVAFVVAATAWFVLSSQPGSQGPKTAEAEEARTYQTDTGERARVQLEDGTQVMLNSKSTLTVPPSFSDSARTVELEGEALFTVAEAENRPFLVEAGGSVTRVLGTVFSVAAYPDEDTVDVVVAEGEVNLRAERARRGVGLTSRERGRLARTDTVVVEQEVDLESYLSWTEGRMVFRDAPFHEVAQRLEREYGIEVRKADPSLQVDRLNATFADESESEVLSIIARTLSLEYTRDGQTVIFTEETGSN